jgi:tetratricopeptide (TPR) repeat protein
MKANRREIRKAQPAAPPVKASPPRHPWQPYALVLGALIAVFWAYAPAAHAPFLFDDNTLLPGVYAPFSFWVNGLRPILMFSYWVNAQISRVDTYFYHLFNVGIHSIAAALVFFIALRLLKWSNAARETRAGLAVFAAAVFLLHPAQTESVAYVAGRSEALSDMLLLAAFTAFLYRRSSAISWLAAAGVTVLFTAALLAKEQTVALPALLLLTDVWWDPDFSFKPVLRNWRLYSILAAGAVFGVVRFWPQIMSASTGGSAGFGLKDLPWYQYLFTQFRALFVYVALFLYPPILTADWDFPISRTLFDRGAIFGFLALVALLALAWRYRRQYRLAAFGFLLYLILMAPTSSFLPIRDPIAERRIYAAMLGFLLIAVDFLGRAKLQRKRLAAVCGAVVLVFAILAHSRAEVWSSARSLWEDTVRKSPDKARVHFQLASAYCGPACGGDLQDQSPPQCGRAVQEYERAAQLEEKPDYDLLVDWAAAYECAGQPDNAVAKLQQAAVLEKSAHVYTQIARIYAEHQNWKSALDALSTAEKVDPNYAVTYSYRGKVHLLTNEPAAAVADFQRAIALDPDIPQVKEDLAQAQARVRGGQ